MRGSRHSLQASARSQRKALGKIIIPSGLQTRFVFGASDTHAPDKALRFAGGMFVFQHALHDYVVQSAGFGRFFFAPEFHIRSRCSAFCALHVLCAINDHPWFIL